MQNVIWSPSNSQHIFLAVLAVAPRLFLPHVLSPNQKHPNYVHINSVPHHDRAWHIVFAYPSDNELFDNFLRAS